MYALQKTKKTSEMIEINKEIKVNSKMSQSSTMKRT
jgi:hypothetical protein